MDHKGWYLPIINEALHDLVYHLFPEYDRELVMVWWTARLNGWTMDNPTIIDWYTNKGLYDYVQSAEMADSREDLAAIVSVIVEDMFTARRNEKIRELREAPVIAERFTRALAFLLHCAQGTPLENALKMAG